MAGSRDSKGVELPEWKVLQDILKIAENCRYEEYG